jgi:hypothetical protein
MRASSLTMVALLTCCGGLPAVRDAGADAGQRADGGVDADVDAGAAFLRITGGVFSRTDAGLDTAPPGANWQMAGSVVADDGGTVLVVLQSGQYISSSTKFYSTSVVLVLPRTLGTHTCSDVDAYVQVVQQRNPGGQADFVTKYDSARPGGSCVVVLSTLVGGMLRGQLDAGLVAFEPADAGIPSLQLVGELSVP